MAKALKKLVIVESPAKAQTIKKILGKNYEVTASNGHIRDLPKTRIGVDVENNFEPSYATIRGKGEITKKLRKLAKSADKIYLASDMDREGEAIAWHISKILNLPENEKNRIEFNAITKSAIQEAIKKPKKIDMDKVDAQQARRILDRLVGYKISPLLWKIIETNTSAGRVQSVALKLICELEDEIIAFVPQKYWEVSGEFAKKFNFNLNSIEGKKVGKIFEEEVVVELEKVIKSKTFITKSAKTTNKSKKPPLPLKTSTLQQLASSYLGFSASRTMRIAQTLYEGLNIDGTHKGLITYMRTDSVRLSKEAKEMAADYILNSYGKEYLGEEQKEKKDGKKIQDAHEAIRPTDVTIVPAEIKSELNDEQYKLYKLIWDRFLISQLAPMRYEQFEIICNYEKYDFRGVANKVTFDGYYKIFKEEDEIKTSDFPEISEGTELKLTKLNIVDGETKPPKRFTESSLVRKLENEGIGRPSTYASIIETLKKRDYVELINKKFSPTDLGYEVKNSLEKYFPNIMNIHFTATLEEDLDGIEEGKNSWTEVLGIFYKDFEKYLVSFEEEVEKISNRRVESDVVCSSCKGIMLLKTGRFGKYLGCEHEECAEKINLKGIFIDKEQIEAGKIIVNDKVQEALKIKNGRETDVLGPEGQKMLLKLGRFGSYLESVNFKEDEIRMSLPTEIRKMLAEKSEKEENGVVLLNYILEDIKAEEQAFIKKAGKCEKCGSEFEVKRGRFGKFLACTGYPDCKNILRINKNGEIVKPTEKKKKKK